MMVASISWAEPINLILMSAPGGIYDLQLRAVEKTLQSAGLQTNYVLANSCKGGAAWLKSNPNKPAIVQTSAEEEVNRMLNPDSDSACDIGFKKSNILSLGLIVNLNVCTMHPSDQAMDRFLKGKNIIGATFIPPTNGILVDGLIDTLKLDAKLIRYQGQVKLMQALLSKDIDFAVLGNVEGPISAGATCFLTMADVSRAKELKRTSLATISPGNPWIDSKQVYAYLGFNVDQSKIRSIVVQTLKNDPSIKKSLSVGYQLEGLAVGQTVDQQWQYIEDHLKKNTKRK